MKNTSKSITRSQSPTAGFSLLELTVAMGIFLIVGAAAVTLVKKHTTLFGSQQSQVGLNVNLRNAAAQLQNDVENAGTGYYQGIDVPSWPVGVTIINNVATAGCYDPATNTYGPACFDALNVIAIDQSTPPSNPMNIPATSCQSTTSSSLFVTPVDPTVPLATLAGDFHTGDQILVVQPGNPDSTIVSVTLSKDGAVNGGKVELQHNPPAAPGTDPLGLSDIPNNKLGTQFCSQAFVLRISAITYSVDASNPANPKLVRTAKGRSDVIAEQIIGFKVGAWTSTTGGYSYDAPPAPAASDYNRDWTTIRAVRASIIGRSSPTGDPNFHNNFDQGNYLVEAASVVINPRNLSMNH